MERRLPIIVLWLSAIALFVLARAFPSLSDRLFNVSPMFGLISVFGLEQIFRLVDQNLGSVAAQSLGTAILIVGGYFVSYLVAGFLAWTKPVSNFALGSVGPIVMFALPHVSADTAISTVLAFTFAAPLLLASYCIGIVTRRQIVGGTSRPNKSLERTRVG